MQASLMPRFVAFVIAAAGVAALSWLALTLNFQEACRRAEWPMGDSCAAAPPASSEELSVALHRLRGNPGDSRSWAVIAAHSQLPAALSLASNRDELYSAATEAAGQHRGALRARANRLLMEKRWADLVPVVVDLIQVHDDPDATRLAAQLISTGTGVSEFLGRVQPGSTWLEQVLPRLQADKVPTGVVIPFIASGLENRVIKPAAARLIIRRLRQDGDLLAAFALWAKVVARPLDPIFNGSFDQEVMGEGFDWELPAATSRSGVVVTQPASEGRGRVLHLRFVGKAFPSPVIRQVLLLPRVGTYTFGSHYAAEKMRSVGGLVWTVRCGSNDAEVARTLPLIDSGGTWQEAKMQFKLPMGCGPFVSLRLETSQSFESSAGMRGQVSLDDVRLVWEGAGP